jgi:WD40 repeat protein
LAVGGDDNKIQVWDVETKKTVQTFEGHTGAVRCLIRLSDELFASGSDDGTVKVWNYKASLVPVPIMNHYNHVGAVFSLKSIKSSEFISCGLGNTIKICSVLKSSSALSIKSKSSPFTCLEIISEVNFASGDAVGKIRIWTYMGSLVNSFNAHRDSVSCLKLINLSTLASGSSDSTIRIWDIKKKTLVKTLSGHLNNIHALELLSPDRLASASDDKKIIIWDTETGAIVETLDGHYGNVNSLQIQP